MRGLTLTVLLAIVPSFAFAVTGLDPKDLSTFVDGILRTELDNRQIPGAVVAVVQGNEVLLLRGYGKADLESNVGVDPERTLFRIGSVTKPFTATAALQLLEQGKLQLKKDLRSAVHFLHVPYPVNIAQLLTHTAGFEERLARTGARSEQGILPLEDYLAREMPAQVMDVLERVRWYESSAFQQLLFFVFLILQITVFWGFDSEIRAVKMARYAAALNLLFYAGLFAGFLFIGPGRIWSGIPWPFFILLSLPLVSIIPVAWMIRCAFSEWRKLRLLYRIRIFIHSLGAAAFLVYLHHWNLLGWRF